MYEVGDLIVYGRTGICEVTEITTLKMDGVPKDKLYYILRPVREKRGKVFTPVDNEKNCHAKSHFQRRSRRIDP